MRRRVVVVAAWVLSAVCALGLGFWAGRAASTPPSVQTTAATVTTVAARSGTLGQRLDYAVNAQWATTVLPSAASGTVTSMEMSVDKPLKVGDTALSVDLRPIVVAQGSVPMFRALGPGATGADVQQLRGFLRAIGEDVAAKGQYDDAVAGAVRRWQKSLGVEPTGTVGAADIIFVPTLPSRIVQAPDIAVGARVAPGQPLLAVPAPEPKLSMQVGPEHVSLVSVGAKVEVVIGGQPRTMEVRSVEPVPEASTVMVTLGGVGGKPVCAGEDCADLVVPGAKGVLPGKVVVVPDTSGTLLPDAAVRTLGDGLSVVTLEDGREVVVTVKASSEGMVIVDEVQPGQRVRVETTRR